MFERFIIRLKTHLKEWDIKYRIHATKRMFERDIEEIDIFETLERGIIIEDYGEDYPFPSVLINRDIKTKRPIHMVVGIDIESKCLYIITVYEPDSEKWKNNFRKRVKR